MHKQTSKFISYVLIGHGCPGIRILRGIAIFSKKYYNRMKGFIKAREDAFGAPSLFCQN